MQRIPMKPDTEHQHDGVYKTMGQRWVGSQHRVTRILRVGQESTATLRLHPCSAALRSPTFEGTLQHSPLWRSLEGGMVMMNEDKTDDGDGDNELKKDGKE